MKLSRIAQIVGGELHGEDAEATVETAIDSRETPQRGLFAALPGDRVDGHEFVPAALEAGAAAALVSRPVEPQPVILVDDVPRAMGVLASHHVAAHRNHLTVIAVTGSMGKTTTKDLLAGILPERSVITAKSYNNELGMPVTALQVTDTTRYLVLEMGADKAGDLDYLTSLVAPDIAVVLAVGSAHLEKFGNVEAVADAKAELVRGLAPGGTAVLNADDPRVAAMAPLARSVLFFGNGSEIRAENVRFDRFDRASFDLVTPAGSAAVSLGLVGAHHVTNALAAAAAARSAGITVEQIAAGLTGRAALSPHRMNVIERPDGVTVIDDSYNANPQSMAAGIDALARIGRGRRTIAVLGPMLELGEVTESEHLAIGQRIATLGIDVVHLLGEIAATIAPPGVETHVHRDLDEVRAALAQQVRSGDVVLFKSSNGARLYEIANEWAS